MNDLILITTNEQGSLVVSTIDFAEGLGIQHKNLLETIRTHKEAIESDFGLIAFETRKVEEKDSTFQTRNLSEKRKSTKPETIAYLTEDQALFIGTLSRNSKRVVEFKATLVKSFAEARKLLLSPPSTDHLLIQLMSQTNQLIAGQQQMLAQLRADVDSIMEGGKPLASRRSTPGKQLTLLPGMRKATPNPASRFGSLRPVIHQRIDEYCALHGVAQSDTYNYLYKRLLDVYGINVYRLAKVPGESTLDAVERYGHLDRVYSLVMAELAYTE